MDATVKIVVPFGVQFAKPMPVLDETALSATNTFSHTGIGDNGQDSDTDSD